MMQYTYEVIKTPSNMEVVLRSDGVFIPFDSSNRDYQEYLASLDEATTL